MQQMWNPNCAWVIFEGQGQEQHAVAKSGTTSSTATVAQSGAAPVQVHNPQNVSIAGQNPSVQANAIAQVPVVAAPTPEQWYQQQYQQYPGYAPYLHYYPPLHQQPFQQYQQHPWPVQGQNQPHFLQAQPHPQPNPVSQTVLQPNVQSQAQVQVQPQMQPQMQVPPRGPALVHDPNQAIAPNFQVNPRQPHPPMQPLQQTLPPPPPPYNQSVQPSPFPQAIGMRGPAQHPQVPQYQQPHVQMPHPQATQAHVKTHMHHQPQPQPDTQSPNQSHVQIQPQPQSYHTQSQPLAFPPQANQSTTPASMPQATAAMQLTVPPVSRHHSYQQPQIAQNIHSGATYQQPMYPHPATWSLHQAPGQVPQQPAMMRLPHSRGSLPQQQPPTLLPPHNQVPGMYPTQQFPPRPSHPIQHRPVMLPVQQAVAQQCAQQPPLNQLHQQSHFPPQQPTQPQLRPPYPPQTQQSQNYVGMPMMPYQGIHLQSHSLPSGGFGPVAHSGPAINQNYVNSTVLEQNVSPLLKRILKGSP